ncbi:MAG: Eco57I restriction-modification methylase domain-containing protein [Candidatus Firestonebacteria bacterium]|nr:Eco57I restriction-modification methylase domain-containing protein [Candidatus Firestonebacteria bacterium]
MFGITDGFDVVIGNPPYGLDYSDIEKKYFQQNYLSTKTITGIQKGSLDSFTIFIEQGYNVLKKNGNLNFIVPIYITSSDSMTALHKLLEENCETIKISSYSVRPQPIFYRTTGGRYFKIITNYSTGSTKEKPIYFEKN